MILKSFVIWFGLQKVKTCGPGPDKQVKDPTFDAVDPHPILKTPGEGVGLISNRTPIASGLSVILNLIHLSPSDE